MDQRSNYIEYSESKKYLFDFEQGSGGRSPVYKIITKGGYFFVGVKGDCPQLAIANLLALKNQKEASYWQSHGESIIVQATEKYWGQRISAQTEEILKKILNEKVYNSLLVKYKNDKKKLSDALLDIIRDSNQETKYPILKGIINNNKRKAFKINLANSIGGLNSAEQKEFLSSCLNIGIQQTIGIAISNFELYAIGNYIKKGHGVIANLTNIKEYLKGIGNPNWKDENFDWKGHAILIEGVRYDLDGKLLGFIVLENGLSGKKEPYFVSSETLKGGIGLLGDVLITDKPLRHGLNKEYINIFNQETINDGDVGSGGGGGGGAISTIKEILNNAKKTISPIILDLNGDGVKTISITNGVKFDHDNNGFAEQTGWVDSNDGLLVLDRNNNGKIDNGTELFGENTILSNGKKATGGFEALSEIDSNNDGIIDSNDTQFADLRIWVDANSNAITDTGELKALSELNVKSISLNYDTINKEDSQGNLITQTATYTLTDNTTRQIADAKFVVDNLYSQGTDIEELTPEIEALPDAKGYGNVYDLRQAMVA